MDITYKNALNFQATDLEDLFLSVNWLSAKYPSRLEQAMNHSSTVISAWDGSKLIGLINALDDSEMTAYVHYVLVNPSYQGLGIGRELVSRIKDHYKNYLYLILMAEKEDKIEFYTHLGFEVSSSTPLIIKNVT